MNHSKTITKIVAFIFLLATSKIYFGQNEKNILPGELIVQLEYKQDVFKIIEEINTKNPLLELTVDHVLANSINIWLLRFNQNNIIDKDALKFVTYWEGISVAQFNHTDVELRNTLPNDPQVNQQWAFFNTDTTGSNNAVGISAQKAWDITTSGATVQGDQLVVAVVDGGFDISHEDINFWTNSGEIAGNGLDDDNNGYIDDVNGWNAYNNNGGITSSSHGTHVAGTVAAKGNNSIGVTGVNWNAKVMAIQGSSGNESTVIAAYGYALDNRVLYDQTNGASGAFVVSTNASFGVDNANPANYPIWCGFYDTLGNYGIISCGATANNNVNIDVVGDVPTACPSDWLISVTNTGTNDDRGFAGYGLTQIDLAAPGTNILSTYPNNSYNSISGTSMATPHVAGTIALMISAGCDDFITAYKAYPDSMALVIIQMIYDNVDPVAGLANECVTGGRLNLYKSVRAVSNYICTPIVLVQSSTDATCGNSNGSATVDVTGNEGPVTSYLWDDIAAQSTQTATGLSSGNYSVIVTDSAGNTNTSVVTVLNSNQPTVSITVDAQISCNGETDASITAIVSGGTPTFSYSWDDGANQTAATATGLGEGTYTVTIEDGANCSETATITVTEPVQLGSSYGINGNTATPSNGVITVIPNGGTPPYSYDWDNGATTAINDGLFQGEYTLTLSDANGCTTVTTYTVGGNVSINESISNKFIGKVYPNPSNGKFQLYLLNINQGNYTIELTNTIGQVLQSKSIEIISNETKIEFNSEGFAKGVYLLNVSSNELLLKSYRIGIE